MTVILEFAPMPGPSQVQAMTLRVDGTTDPAEAVAKATAFARTITTVPIRYVAVETPKGHLVTDIPPALSWAA